MSSDRFGNDDDLSADLRAFGQTLEHLVEEPLRPRGSSPAGFQAKPVKEPHRMEVSRTNRAVWLAAAALLLVAGGFGIGRLWPVGDGSIDSTGSPDADFDGDVDEEGRSPVEPEPAPSETTVPVAPIVPSAITSADGTVLAVVDDLEPLSLNPATVLQTDGDVVTRAVLAELVRLEIFGQASREEVADRLTSDGVTITTSFDPAIAELARASIAALRPEGDRPDEVAVLTVDNRTGAIVATASSGSPTAVLIDGLRQPGSAFKPVVLATLFEQGRHPDDLVDGDGPCQFTVPDDQGGGLYTVGGSEHGIQNLRAVTLSSNNCAFVRLGQAAGLDQVAAMAQDLGLSTIHDELGDFLSLPLGVGAVHGVELAGAYATLANGGAHRAPWMIDEVLDREGRALYQRAADANEVRPVIKAETAALLTSVLEDNVRSGTGIRAQLNSGHRAAGKTGTTANMVDAWFVGFTTRYTTVVWVGDPNDTMTPIRIPGWSSFGGALPAAIWARYNDELHRQLDPEPFPDAPNIEEREPVTLVAERELTNG